MGPQVIVKITEKMHVIRDRLKIVQSHSKSYVDLHRQEVEHDVGDYIFLKVSPMHGVTRFGIEGKLAPRCVGLLRSSRELVTLLIAWDCQLNWVMHMTSFTCQCLRSTLVTRHTSCHMQRFHYS